MRLVVTWVNDLQDHRGTNSSMGTIVQNIPNWRVQKFATEVLPTLLFSGCVFQVDLFRSLLWVPSFFHIREQFQRVIAAYELGSQSGGGFHAVR